MENCFRAVFLATLISLAGCQSAEAPDDPFKWPGNQAGLTPSASTSSVKAELPPMTLTPAALETEPESAAFGGIWEGWRCSDKGFDMKIAVLDVTNDGATVHYAAAAADAFGPRYAEIPVHFSEDILRGTVSIGKKAFDFVLGMRADAHMNVKVGPCTGILAQTKAVPKI